MKLHSGKNSLAFLCILAGIVYLLILVPAIIGGIKGGIEGAREGAKSYQKTSDSEHYNDFDSESYFLRLKLKDKKNYYPDSLLNITTGKTIPSRIEKVQLRYEFEDSLPLWNILFRFFLGLGMVPIIVLLVLIPIHFYKLIFSMYRNQVFTPYNVKRIARIGTYCIIVFTYTFLFHLHLYLEAKFMIDLEKYEIVFPKFSNETLLFGVVALIVATVMKRAIEIKEEQDLTI